MPVLIGFWDTVSTPRSVHRMQAAGIGNPATAGDEQQGTARQFTGPEDRAPERHHGRAGRPHPDEHAGAELNDCAGWAEGYFAESCGLVRVAARAARRRCIVNR